jgi:hypothetical protein
MFGRRRSNWSNLLIDSRHFTVVTIEVRAEAVTRAASEALLDTLVELVIFRMRRRAAAQMRRTPQISVAGRYTSLACLSVPGCRSTAAISMLLAAARPNSSQLRERC